MLNTLCLNILLILIAHGNCWQIRTKRHFVLLDIYVGAIIWAQAQNTMQMSPKPVLAKCWC